MVKKLEYLISRVLWSCGFTQANIKRNIRRGRVPILVYHSISKIPKKAGKRNILWETDMAVSKETFTEQLTEFRKWFRLISVREYLDQEGGGAMNNSLVLTFDDGYADNFDVARPILRSQNAGASFYLIGCHLNGEAGSPVHLQGMLYDGGVNGAAEYFNAVRRCSSAEDAINICRELKNRGIGNVEISKRFISPKQAKSLVEEGYEIGGHGYYHLKPEKEDMRRFKEELVRSRRAIVEISGGERVGFAFPFGTRDVVGKKEIEAARSCNFDYVVTSDEGVNEVGRNTFCLKRIAMEEMPLQTAMFRISGLREKVKRYARRNA